MPLFVSLRNYQRQAVDKAKAAFDAGHKGFLIGDKMGLGKTIEALAIADEMPKRHNLVAVVAPAFLCPKWRREIEEKTTGRSYRYVLASYSQLSKPQELYAFTQRSYDLIIFDEVHYLKDWKSLRTRACFGGNGDRHRTAVSVAGRLLGLSGTWPPNNVGDCHTWFRATDHELGRMTFTEFVFRFAAWAEQTQYGLRHRGIKNLPEFHKAFAPVYIGREIDEVSDEIPEGRREFELIETPKDLQKAEREIFAALLTHAGHSPDEAKSIVNFDEYFERLINTTPDFARLAEFRRRQGFVKIKAVLEFIVDVVWPENKKVLLFCYHKDVAEKYAADLKKAKIPCTVVHGSNTTTAEREQALHAADQADEHVLICTIDAVREGFDLVGFACSIFAEIDWRPWALEQAEGRTRRIGQKKNVAWYYFTFDSGVDEAMRKKLSEKTDVIKKIRGVK